MKQTTPEQYLDLWIRAPLGTNRWNNYWIGFFRRHEKELRRAYRSQSKKEEKCTHPEQ